MKNLIIALMLCVSIPCFAGPIQKRAQANVNEIMSEVDRGMLGAVTNRALDNILAVAYRELKRAGYSKYAEEIRSQWENEWFVFLMQRDVGDHAGRV